MVITAFEVESENTVRLDKAMGEPTAEGVDIFGFGAC